MIKRRFYRHEHGDQDGHSSSSSSSDSEVDSDSVSEPQLDKEVEQRDDETGTEEMGVVEDYINSDEDEDEDDEDGEDSEDEMQRRFPFSAVHRNITSSQPIAGAEAKKYGKINASDISVDCNDPIQADLSFILKYKSIYKCRLCPKVICLSEETVKRHLSSKAHARSKKQFQGGRLKVMLNSDGEIEEEQETHAERYARIVALAEGSSSTEKKRGSGRLQWAKRMKKRMLSHSNSGNIEKAEKQEKKAQQKTDGKSEKPNEMLEKKRNKIEGKTEKPKEKQEDKRQETDGDTKKPREKRGKKRLKTENLEEMHGKKRPKTEENTKKPKAEKHEKNRPKTGENTEKPKKKHEKKRQKTEENTEKPKVKKQKKQRKTEGC